MTKKKEVKKEETLYGFSDERMGELISVVIEMEEGSKHQKDFYEKIKKYPVKSVNERDFMMSMYGTLTDDWIKYARKSEVIDSIETIDVDEMTDKFDNYEGDFVVTVDDKIIATFSNERALSLFVVALEGGLHEGAVVKSYFVDSCICNECRENKAKENIH